MKIRYILPAFFLLVLSGLAAAGMVQSNNRKLFFSIPVLDFEKVYRLNPDEIREKISKVEFQPPLDNITLSSEFQKESFIIRYLNEQKAIVQETYFYRENKLTKIEISLGNNLKMYRDFTAVISNGDDVLKIAYSAVLFSNGEEIENKTEVGLIEKNYEEVWKDLPRLPISEVLKENDPVKRKPDEISASRENWIEFLNNIFGKKPALYGVWQNDMIAYVFDVNSCRIGVLFGKCDNISFNDKTKRGSFDFTEKKNNRKMNFEFIDNQFSFALRPRGGAWVVLKPYCSNGYSRIYWENEGFYYKCF